ncbi:hypothetical protein GCM10010401_06920 [Rarobacter faecitabidus]|uniref:Uncharacterized protein n=1 Tax=Rarobacter faecitabidus TaxID=13243 RepID=A0A542ZTK9_RARFA|nr:hypothetical protein [Rarobacter faecitabidus]TQL63560.1 hypothetical protein FB461_0020 [Rarobacter faecitabidus]
MKLATITAIPAGKRSDGTPITRRSTYLVDVDRQVEPWSSPGSVRIFHKVWNRALQRHDSYPAIILRDSIEGAALEVPDVTTTDREAADKASPIVDDVLALITETRATIDSLRASRGSASAGMAHISAVIDGYITALAILGVGADKRDELRALQTDALRVTNS